MGDAVAATSGTSGSGGGPAPGAGEWEWDQSPRSDLPVRATVVYQLFTAIHTGQAPRMRTARLGNVKSSVKCRLYQGACKLVTAYIGVGR